MRKSVFLAALLLLSGSAVAIEKQVLLTGKTLEKAVSGKTIYIETPLAEIPIRYQPNGTMTGSSTAALAALAGEKVKNDTGRWWVRRAELCQQWNSWSKGRALCYKLRVTGSKVAWSRSDGESGTARLAN